MTLPMRMDAAHAAPSTRPLRRWLLVAGAAIAVCAALFVVWRSRSAPPPMQAQGRDVPRLDGKWIRFSPDFAKRSKIEFARGEQTTLSPVINVTGTMTFDPDKVAAIGARIAGRVRRILKFPGDPVAMGETVIELESAELGQAQAAVLGARAHAEAAMANQTRETQLAEARV
jgi:cobalt-zinc-cadmium efflux system membrane fusion protein